MYLRHLHPAKVAEIQSFGCMRWKRFGETRHSWQSFLNYTPQYPERHCAVSGLSLIVTLCQSRCCQLAPHIRALFLLREVARLQFWDLGFFSLIFLQVSLQKCLFFLPSGLSTASWYFRTSCSFLIIRNKNDWD